jgi:hypothetical protein
VKIIFLDIDGVLNNPGCYAIASGTHTPADSICVAALNHILIATGALIVISSTWKLQGLMFCKEKLARWGVKPRTVLDATPNLQGEGKTRAEEIQEWLDRNGDRHPIEAFVILDDEADLGHLTNSLIKTAGYRGLIMPDAEKAITMLAGTTRKGNKRRKNVEINFGRD